MRSRGLVVVFTVTAALMAVPAGAHADLTFNGTIEGRVTLWGSGEPVEGAEVRGVYEHGAVDTTTDADGYYRLETLESGTYNVTFRIGSSDPFWYYPGTYEWSEATDLTIINDEVYTGIDGMVQEVGTMIGRVTDDTTGDPVAGMCADVYDTAKTVVGTAVSNADGWLLYPGITVGTSDQWLASAARLYDCSDLGYIDEWYRNVPPQLSGGHNVVEYLSEQGRFDAAVGAPAAIGGTVTDAGDTPLAGICVSLNYSNSVLATTTSDDAGYYEFLGLTAGDHYSLDLEDCGSPMVYMTLDRVPVAAISGATSYYNHVLEPTASINGTVTDASTGLPLEGICVLATADLHAGAQFGTTSTDASGFYSLAVPAVVEHQYVHAYWCGGSPALYANLWWDDVTTYEEATDLQVGDGEHRTGVDFALPDKATTENWLTVSVDDLLGRSLEDVCVAVSGDAAAEGKTGTDGTVVLALAGGDYTVTAGVAGTGCVAGYEEANGVGLGRRAYERIDHAGATGGVHRHTGQRVRRRHRLACRRRGHQGVQSAAQHRVLRRPGGDEGSDGGVPGPGAQPDRPAG